MTKEELEAVFAPYGVVTEATIIIDKFSKRSKGFGFVDMQNDGDGRKAIEELNNKEVKGRTIRVSEAKPKKY